LRGDLIPHLVELRVLSDLSHSGEASELSSKLWEGLIYMAFVTHLHIMKLGIVVTARMGCVKKEVQKRKQCLDPIDSAYRTRILS
jgi:hypothetical protein